MVKESDTKSKKKEAKKPEDQKNIVDKILKNKNRFRSGLGFKQSRSNKEEEKARISQAVSKKKILQGTKADENQRGDEDDIQGGDSAGVGSFIELGNKNYYVKDEADENVPLSQQIGQKKSKFWDPRQAFLDMIEKDQQNKS